VPLFTSLPLTLSLETLGGIAAPLAPRGTPLPIKRRSTFTTADDNQKAIEVHLVVGESPMAARNLRVASIELGGLPERPRGMVSVEVAYAVDRSGRITITASVPKTDLSTTSVNEVGELLDTETITRLLAAAEEYAEEDREAVRAIEARNAAQGVLAEAERELERAPPSSGADELARAIASLGLALAESESAVPARTEELRGLLQKRQQSRAQVGLGVFATMLSPGASRAAPAGVRRPPKEPAADAGIRHSASGPSVPPRSGAGAPVAVPAKEGGMAADRDPARVFVVHGRNDRLRRDFFAFLRALKLHPIEWSEAVDLTGEASPYIGTVLDAAFAHAQAVVVLLSPDDDVRLAKTLWQPNEAEHERTVRQQPRANVLFEAGLAMGREPNRTVLVQIGGVKGFSDVAGRHIVHLDNSPERRQDVAQRLRRAGCPVSIAGRDWLRVGDLAQ
jgi:predicted nucleotide-binding protein